MNIITGISVVVATIFAFLIPSLRKENKRLQKELKTQENLNKLNKENAEILKINSAGDFVSASAKLRKRKTGASQ